MEGDGARIGNVGNVPSAALPVASGDDNDEVESGACGLDGVGVVELDVGECGVVVLDGTLGLLVKGEAAILGETE